MKITKKISLQAHARRRAKERYGLALTKKLRREIVERIRNGSARFLGRQSLRVTGWEVGVEGKALTVLYDCRRKTLITVLPPGAVWEGSSYETPVGV
jgi:hypothetical protein